MKDNISTVVNLRSIQDYAVGVFIKIKVIKNICLKVEEVV